VVKGSSWEHRDDAARVRSTAARLGCRLMPCLQVLQRLFCRLLLVERGGEKRGRSEKGLFVVARVRL
jgi:hypothetical protein